MAETNQTQQDSKLTEPERENLRSTTRLVLILFAAIFATTIIMGIVSAQLGTFTLGG